MCPGGEVINAASEVDGLVVNGMSRMARKGEYSNSALVDRGATGLGWRKARGDAFPAEMGA